MTILDVYVGNFKTKDQSREVDNFIHQFMFKIFKKPEIPKTPTPEDMVRLTNAVLSLSSPSRICYILIHILDDSYNLSEESAKNKMAEKFLANKCFMKYRDFIIMAVDDDDDDGSGGYYTKKASKNIERRKKVEEELGIYIYSSYEEYIANVQKRLRKERIEKLTRIQQTIASKTSITTGN